MDMGDHHRDQRQRVDADAPELLDRASAAVEEHGALGRGDDDRRGVAYRRRDRAGGAEKREVHQRAFRLAGSKRASAGFVLIAIERTVNSMRSLPSTNISWRYGK